MREYIYLCIYMIIVGKYENLVVLKIVIVSSDILMMVALKN